MMRCGKDGWAATRSTPAAVAVGLAAAGLGLAMAGTGHLNAQTPGETATYEGKRHHYTVTLPAGCRHVKGPGTVDAVCAPDFDTKKSAVASAAGALLLAVAAESLDAVADTSVAALLQRYTEAAFKEELPEAICGEQDRARVKIENVSQSVQDTRLVYIADVTCPRVKFLQLGARRAVVRHVIGPDAVYRLVARAPADEFQKQRSTIDAFFASFRLRPVEKAEK